MAFNIPSKEDIDGWLCRLEDVAGRMERAAEMSYDAAQKMTGAADTAYSAGSRMGEAAGTIDAASRRMRG